MISKELYIGAAIFIGFLFSIVLFTDSSVEDIEILNTANLTVNHLDLYRQTLPADDRETHCQIGQLFIDGKHIESDYEKAFFHFFLCEKQYDWTSRSGRQRALRKYRVHTTYKQFIPVFKSNDIDIKMEIARDKALIYAKSNGLSILDVGRVENRIKRSFSKAVTAHKKVSSGKTYFDLIMFSFAMFFILFIWYSAGFDRLYLLNRYFWR